MMPRPPDVGACVAGSSPTTACVGTWNMSHCTPTKVHIAASEVGADIMAVQETHLAAFPLECTHGTARQLGLHLHHGHPVPPVAQGVYGRSCGVGFLVGAGRHWPQFSLLVPPGVGYMLEGDFMLFS